MNLALAYRDYLDNLRKNDPVYWIENNLYTNIDLYDQQKYVLRDRSPRKAAVFGRRTGKTTLVCLESLYTALTGSNRRVVVVSRGIMLRVMFQFLMDIVANSGVDIRSVFYTHRVTFSNGSTIEVCSPHSDMLRSGTVDLLCVDEIAHFTSHTVQFIELVMAASRGGSFFAAFTPMPNMSEIGELLRTGGFSVHHCSLRDIPGGEEICDRIEPEMNDEAIRREVLAEFAW